MNQLICTVFLYREYPRFLALKTFCRDYTHPRFVAPSHLIGTVWKIHVIDEDDYELVTFLSSTKSRQENEKKLTICSAKSEN